MWDCQKRCMESGWTLRSTEPSQFSAGPLLFSSRSCVGPSMRYVRSKPLQDRFVNLQDQDVWQRPSVRLFEQGSAGMSKLSFPSRHSSSRFRERVCSPGPTPDSHYLCQLCDHIMTSMLKSRMDFVVLYPKQPLHPHALSWYPIWVPCHISLAGLGMSSLGCGASMRNFTGVHDN